jgi:aminoglycoside N3'-acetyltransferase
VDLLLSPIIDTIMSPSMPLIVITSLASLTRLENTGKFLSLIFKSVKTVIITDGAVIAAFALVFISHIAISIADTSVAPTTAGIAASIFSAVPDRTPSRTMHCVAHGTKPAYSTTVVRHLFF